MVIVEYTIIAKYLAILTSVIIFDRTPTDKE